jgi:hypothetical protein
MEDQEYDPMLLEAAKLVLNESHDLSNEESPQSIIARARAKDPAQFDTFLNSRAQSNPAVPPADIDNNDVTFDFNAMDDLDDETKQREKRLHLHV